MPHPAEDFIKLIEETDINNTDSLIKFAKENAKLQNNLNEMIFDYINFVRVKNNKLPLSNVEVSVEEALPFRTGMIADYLRALDKNVADKLCQKMKNISIALGQKLEKAPKNQIDQIENWGHEHLLVISMETAFTIAEEFKNYAIPEDDQALQNVKLFLHSDKSDVMKSEINILEKERLNFINLIKGSIDTADIEQKKILKKVDPKKTHSPLLHKGYTQSRKNAAKAFEHYMKELNTIKNALEEIIPLDKELSLKELKKHRNELIKALKKQSESLYNHTNTLEENKEIKSLHLHKKTWLGSIVTSGLAAILKKLHQFFPTHFPEKPAFLTHKTQTTTGTLHKNIQEKRPKI